MKYMKIQKAFTLIEILVVVAILAILMTIIITNVESTQKKARDSRRMSEITQIMKAVRAYNIDKAHFPVGENDDDGWDIGKGANLFIPELVNSGLTKSVPVEIKDSMAGYRYKYFPKATDELCSGADMNNYMVLWTECESDSCDGDNIVYSDICEEDGVLFVDKIVTSEGDINNIDHDKYLFYIIKE